MIDRLTRAGRAGIVLFGVGVAAAVGFAAFVYFPATLADLLGVVLVIAAVVVGARFAGRAADAAFPTYSVAEVAVEGPITRDGGGLLPTRPGGVTADDVVEQIEAADADKGAKALLLKLNTPGGEVVPSDDIRLAAEAFDGPTVAYATDVCASGGYWIASGCDEFWARDLSVVGSIGVLGSLVNAAELTDRLGLSYERFAAGEFKDSGSPLREMTADERDYLQGLIDDYYDRFVDRVTAARDLDDAEVRGTEARVYLGEEARDIGLVDEIGTREDVEDRLEELLGAPARTEEFAPRRGLSQRLRSGAALVAAAFGAGLARAVVGDADVPNLPR